MGKSDRGLGSARYAGRFIAWLDGAARKFYDWRERYGKVNEHNGWVFRDFWLEEWEKQATAADVHDAGCRHCGGEPDQRLAGAGATGLLSKWNGKPSKKGTGLEQPVAAHQHWHVDVSYINISGTFYYLCSILDGCSRYIANWDLRESMTEADIEVILERAKELRPEARPRIISEGHARRESAGDPRREESEVGRGAKTAADSPAAGCVNTFWGHCTRCPLHRHWRRAARSADSRIDHSVRADSLIRSLQESRVPFASSDSPHRLGQVPYRISA